VLKWVFFVALQSKPTERPVVLVEDFLVSPHFRRALVTALFEVYEVPLVLCLPHAVCSLTLTGCTSGVVVDVGEAETRVMPVFDNFLISSAFIFRGLGMADARSELARLVVARRTDLLASLPVDAFGDTANVAAELSTGVHASGADQTWIKDMLYRLGAVYSRGQVPPVGHIAGRRRRGGAFGASGHGGGGGGGGGGSGGGGDWRGACVGSETVGQ
jgi:uncharacterized membrane protein YgcG